MVHRLFSIARRKIESRLPVLQNTPARDDPAVSDTATFGELLSRKLAAREEASQINADAVMNGRFQFLNEERRLGEQVDWLSGRSDVPHLWRFQLHYHEFLLDLVFAARTTGESRYIDRAWDLVRQWINLCPLSAPGSRDDAWHPFCISRRLPEWIALRAASPPNEDLDHSVLQSVFAQACYLARHLEWDVGGNHLMENLKALVLAGCLFRGPEADRWIQKSFRILRRQLDEQILPHGEHCERAPMYHCQVLEALLDMADAAKNRCPELAALCQSRAARMAGFLAEIVHPDGDVPLLGDTSRQRPKRLIEAATGSRRERGSTSRGPGSRIVGDYWTFRDGDEFFLLDAGAVGCNHLPAHAHSDLHTFEATVDGRRLFVDSGVFGYDDDTMRSYARSTAAHNVLQVDGREQCDVWSRFRMGHRGRPTGLWAGTQGGFHWARATHNAYRRIGVPSVGRYVACRPEGPWIVLDWAEGRGRHQLTSRLHLHPDASVEQVALNEVRITLAGRLLRLSYFTTGELRLRAGWYCPRFGERQATTVLEWSTTAKLPAACGWALSWNDTGAAHLDEAAGPFNITWRENGKSIDLAPLSIFPGD